MEPWKDIEKKEFAQKCRGYVDDYMQCVVLRTAIRRARYILRTDISELEKSLIQDVKENSPGMVIRVPFKREPSSRKVEIDVSDLEGDHCTLPLEVDEMKIFLRKVQVLDKPTMPELIEYTKGLPKDWFKEESRKHMQTYRKMKTFKDLRQQEKLRYLRERVMKKTLEAYYLARFSKEMTVIRLSRNPGKILHEDRLLSYRQRAYRTSEGEEITVKWRYAPHPVQRKYNCLILRKKQLMFSKEILRFFLKEASRRKKCLKTYLEDTMKHLNRRYNTPLFALVRSRLPELRQFRYKLGLTRKAVSVKKPPLTFKRLLHFGISELGRSSEDEWSSQVESMLAKAQGATRTPELLTFKKVRESDTSRSMEKKGEDSLVDPSPSHPIRGEGELEENSKLPSATANTAEDSWIHLEQMPEAERDRELSSEKMGHEGGTELEMEDTESSSVTGGRAGKKKSKSKAEKLPLRYETEDKKLKRLKPPAKPKKKVTTAKKKPVAKKKKTPLRIDTDEVFFFH